MRRLRLRRRGRPSPREAQLVALGAVAEYGRQVAAARTREVIHLRGEIVALPLGVYRWLLWDNQPYFAEQVEGVLVPYGCGSVESDVAAMDAIEDAVRRLAAETTGVVILDRVVPRTPIL